MGRKHRVEYEGAIYHIIQRGNNREYIFGQQEEKEYLLKDIVKKRVDLDYKLLGYVIMDNHYHFLLQTGNEPLKTIMHSINNKYGKYYNRHRGKTGHVFGERYKAILVQNESYLLSLLRYIHQNPVRAGICCLVEEFAWSSDRAYRKGNDNEIDIDIILESISNNRNNAIKHYIEFMMVEDEAEHFNEKYIGEEAFQLIASQKSKVNQRKRLDEILADTGANQEEYSLIKAGSRKRNLTVFKIDFAKKAHEHNYTLEEIGQHIKLSDTAIFKLVNS